MNLTRAREGKNPFHHVTFVHRRSTLERLEKFLSPNHFTDCNLFGKLIKCRKSVKLSCFGPTGRQAFKELKEQNFQPVEIGHSFGPTFSTHWFKVEAEIPCEWDSEDVVFLWESGSEAMIWRDGQPVFSMTSESIMGIRKFYRIKNNLQQSDPHNVTLFVEVACNGLFGAGGGGFINPPDMKKMFSVSKAEIAIVNRDAWDLFYYFQILYEIAQVDKDDGNRALDVANDSINAIVASEFINEIEKGYNKAKAILCPLFTGEKRIKHRVHALGHCHIDSAWLWPFDETIRKCARSWVSTLNLMDRYENLKFTCSQAQQYAWVKEFYPKLFERIRGKVKSGNFLPVGGTWVEMDGNLPSGESMIRQFVFGQRFFRKEFGMTCKDFWLPDTFGYSANFPQIMKEAGIKNFLTQKMSWNLVNKFPHTTFVWQGIDGSKVLTHFPPADTYGSNAMPKDILKTVSNCKEKGKVEDSALLFGIGDGGGGPTEDMLERITRMNECNFLPSVEMTSTDELFASLCAKEDKLHTWHGEMFLELHNGTYTTQASIKKFNRKCEVLLHDIEIAATMSWLINRKTNYPHDEIDELWKLLLLNQFHDVLPGSSIEMVHDDALRNFKTIITKGKSLLHTLLQNNDKNNFAIFNSLPWKRREIISVGNSGGKKLVEVNGLSVSGVKEIKEYYPVKVSSNNDGTVIISNEYLHCKFDTSGRMISLKLISDNQLGEDMVLEECFANQMVIFDDVPLYWDAWDVMDYHLETRKPLLDLLEPLSMDRSSSDICAILSYKLKISNNSWLAQKIILESGARVIKFETEVEWHENHKFLKVEFPWAIHSSRATYEIQFGHIERPTHQNTSWDSAKYEVWAHKWADYSQYDRGIALLNDCKYGYSTFGSTMRLSLLRSPKAPDGNSDMGRHSFTYGIMPHAGSFQSSDVIHEAYQMNYPLTVVQNVQENGSIITIDNKAVILETVKVSDVHEGSILVRLYESFGGSVTNAQVSFPKNKILNLQSCNVLEDVYGDVKEFKGDRFYVNLMPFQMKTFLIKVE